MSEPVTIFERDGDAPPTWVPVDACTLPTVEQPVRVAEFDALFTESSTSVEQAGPARARFVLSGGADLARRVQGLADRETGCCSFFTFTVTPAGAGRVTMDVEVPDGRAEVLAALVQRAQEAGEGTTGARPA
jgi:hypothetical protein